MKNADLFKDTFGTYATEIWSMPENDFLKWLNEDAEPKTGHWIVDGSVDCYLDKVRCHCSKCGIKKEFPADYDHIKHKLSISYQYSEFIDNYCPNCGSKMVELTESEDKE